MIYLSGKRFTDGGLDCVLEGGERTAIRESFAYYSGQSAAFIPSLSLRRQFVVLDGTDGFRVLYNTNDFTSAKAPEVLEAIHSVTLEGVVGEGLTYAMWAIREELPTVLASPEQDADGDGMANLVEFYFDTPPKVKGASPVAWSGSEAGYQLSFPDGKDRSGVEVEVEFSDDLETWEALAVDEGQWTREQGEGSDRRVLAWKPGDDGMPSTARFLRLKLRLAP